MLKSANIDRRLVYSQKEFAELLGKNPSGMKSAVETGTIPPPIHAAKGRGGGTWYLKSEANFFLSFCNVQRTPKEKQAFVRKLIEARDNQFDIITELIKIGIMQNETEELETYIGELNPEQQHGAIKGIGFYRKILLGI